MNTNPELDMTEDMLRIKRVFMTAGMDPFNTVDWELRDARVGSADNPVFEQTNVEFPKSWSTTASNIVAQKYFRGRLGTRERETSLRQVITRVVNSICRWAKEFRYFDDEERLGVFRDELTYLLLHQYASFNSPVWFNIGAEGRPVQASACFILDLQDSMKSIEEWITTEADIFRGASGSGVNVSRLREDGAPLSRGGTSSGPISFMRWADAGAGAIKSGGSSRRAAKMVIMDIDHPDIEEFIGLKAREEEKIRVLRDAGFEVDFDGRDTHTLGYQNANNSVRVSDEFMRAVEENGDWNLISRYDGRVVKTVRARELMGKIAEAAWKCADPGIQFDTMINRWNTTPTIEHLSGSNPCLTGDTPVNTNRGLIPFFELLERFQQGEEIRVWTSGVDGMTLSKPSAVMVTGVNQIISLTVSNRTSPIRCTPNHKILTNNRGWIEAQSLRPDDQIVTWSQVDGKYEQEIAYLAHREAAGREVTYDLAEPKNHSFLVDGIVVHNCSEHIRRNNSSCNLASVNLMKFMREDGTFDIDLFQHVVRVMFTAMDILISGGEFPTERIKQVTHEDRDLGLGYCNLGALLMAKGMPYDSDEGRSYAAAITHLLTSTAYRQSARLAKKLGPFPSYLKDPAGAQEVMGMHSQAAAHTLFSSSSEKIGTAAGIEWGAVWDDTRAHGLRNAQATVLAPTGCLVGGSLIATDRGLVRLHSLGDPDGSQWQNLRILVSTDEGTKEATKFYINGVEDTVLIETSRGYRIQGTAKHRVKVINRETGVWDWKRFGDITPGDIVPLALHQIIGVPQEVVLPPLNDAYWTGEHRASAPRCMSPSLAELVGYFMGDGSLHSRGLRFCVTDRDFDVTDRLTQLSKELFGLSAVATDKAGYTEVRIDSVRIALWWEACGFAKYSPADNHTGKGYTAHIPNAILHANDRAVYAAFIRGLFEADGDTSSGYPTLKNTSVTMVRDIQSLLLALGYPTTLWVGQRTGSWGTHDLVALRLLNQSYSKRWLDEVGFISDRKNAGVITGDTCQASRCDHIPFTPTLIDRLAPVGNPLRRTLLAEHKRGKVSRRVATELYRHTHDAELAHLLSFFYDEVGRAEIGDEELTYDISVPSNMTYSANGFISHNTISFMMDAATTGVEPEFALVKVKRLVGGGTIRTVNPIVGIGLRTLGYDGETVAGVLSYVNEHSTVIGAPGLDPVHYPVFATSMGDNSIAAMGHVKMMAAVQPGVAGAISKTINLPSSATVDDVFRTYMEAWKMGVKCIALYVEGSKVAEPMKATGKEEKKTVVVAPVPFRRRLPRQRPSLTTSFRIQNQGAVTCEGYMQAGMYPEDSTLGEIFVKVAKQGSTLAGVMDAFAIAVSIGLQYGVPLEAFVEKFINMRFEPSGGVDDPDFLAITSLMDYLFRRLAGDHLDLEARQRLGVLTIRDKKQLMSEMPGMGDNGHGEVGDVKVGAPGMVVDAPLCYQCGVYMQAAGTCFVCGSCGSTSGCS